MNHGHAMKNPPHPGHSVKDACLHALGITVTEGAKVPGVARHTLSRVVNGQAGLTPEMAIRLEKAGGRMHTTTTGCLADRLRLGQSAFSMRARSKPAAMSRHNSG